MNVEKIITLGATSVIADGFDRNNLITIGQ